MYRIGEFSRRSQIPVKTLRYYDEIGLLRPAHVDGDSGYRYYSASQFEELNRILVFKDLGLSLKEISELARGRVTVDEIRAVLLAKRDELERHVEAERARLARAEARIELMARFGEGALGAVAVRRVAGRTVASVRDTLSCYDDVEALFVELERDTGLRNAERAAIWHGCGTGAVDCEAFLALPAPAAVRGRVEVRVIESHDAATVVYRAEDERAAYRTLKAWVAAAGVATGGPHVELYLDPGGDAGRAITEIQQPLARAPRGGH